MNADNSKERIREIRELFALARQGDAYALEKALALLRPHIIAVIRSRLPDATAREDIAQDVLIKILRVLPNLPKEADTYAYFLTMARNTAVDYIRKQTRNLATESIDLFADELLDAGPADNDVFSEVINFVLSISTAPYRILVYLNNRFIYPSRHGADGRHRGFPSMIVDELGGLELRLVAKLTFAGLRDEFAAVDRSIKLRFLNRLDETENGMVFAEMTLRETLGERPTAIISMWTDRINKQVAVYVMKQINSSNA